MFEVLEGGEKMKIDKSLLSGTTVLLVLSLLQQEDQYGYQMIAALSAR